MVVGGGGGGGGAAVVEGGGGVVCVVVTLAVVLVAGGAVVVAGGGGTTVALSVGSAEAVAETAGGDALGGARETVAAVGSRVACAAAATPVLPAVVMVAAVVGSGLRVPTMAPAAMATIASASAAHNHAGTLR